MKRLIPIIGALIAIFAFNGCGETKTYETIENNITVEEPYPIPNGTTLIIDGVSDSTVSSDVESQTITIECGGTCGDITIGVPVE